jgi:alginate O-acetyltransferase complex protein AlgI
MRPETQRPTAVRPAPHRRFLPATEPEPGSGQAWPGLYPGEPEACRRDPWQFLPIVAHLGLFLAVFKVFRVEGRAFQLLVTVALAALPVHYLLPYRWKKPLFVAVSIAGLALVFGAVAAAYVVALSLLLIGVCRLPIPWWTRATTLAAAALALAWVRPESLAAAIPESVWPILATMFMFRILIYLYELKHAKAPESAVDTLSYFFLLPNYCFLHFPVVDYRTLHRGYFAKEIHATQRAGLQMMFQGTIHLLLYRLVYHEWLIPAEEVHGAASLARYLVCNYLLYLRVSGQFHMACGMLHLFGFQLPPTHHHYLLATGFTDYWRRINIYWKDFMVRLVFNPVVFRLKRWPQPAALAVATVVVFVATWALHAYQSFWLRGSWGISGPDALFWGILGALVLVNVQLDARRPRGRAGKGPVTALGTLVRGAKVAATFTTIALLWSLWSSPSLESWLDLMRRGTGI